MRQPVGWVEASVVGEPKTHLPKLSVWMCLPLLALFLRVLRVLCVERRYLPSFSVLSVFSV